MYNLKNGKFLYFLLFIESIFNFFLTRLKITMYLKQYVYNTDIGIEIVFSNNNDYKKIKAIFLSYYLQNAVSDLHL